MITETSLEAFNSLQFELGERQQQVLNALFTLGTANNKMIANYLKLGINQVTARIFELRELKMVGFSHEDKCPFTHRNTYYWKVTKLGEITSEKIDNPQIDSLLIRPFQVIEGDTYTRYVCQVKSSSSYKFYNVEIKSIWDNENKQYYFKKFCECEGFHFSGDCKHCHRLEDELKKWNVI